MLLVKSVSASYMPTTTDMPLKVLEGISFEASKGEYCSIVGPSGCGKTTLLMCLAGLVRPETGSIELDGLPPAEVREGHKLGFVFQKPVFFEWKTVLENVSLAAEISGRESATQHAQRYLREFHLNGVASAYPHELSGGMLSRAALARALVHEPDLLLLDEAFNHLDEALRDTINLDIQTLWMSRRPTIIAVTHSIAEAVFMSDRVIVLSHKPSTILNTFNIPFERPRKVGIRIDPRFTALVEQVRSALGTVYQEKFDESQ